MGLASRPHRRWCIACVPLIIAIASGCSGVREDRTIQWSGDGKAVAFQHGGEGVFVKWNGKVLKIFTPDKETLATSTPLWSPDGTAVVFTTCKSADPNAERPTRTENDWDANPDGRIFHGQPIRYSCWLKRFGPEVAESKPVKLFEADCDHAGYVAAGLAVRWGDKGGIYYLRGVGPGKHTVDRFDLNSKTSRREFAHSGETVVFDYNQTSQRLICVIASQEDRDGRNGIWIGRPENRDWWHIRESMNGGRTAGGGIEDVRRMLPVWGRAGTGFAYSRQVSSDPPGFEIRRGTLKSRTVTTLLKTTEPVFDLNWSPDETRLGFVKGGLHPRLHVLKINGGLSNPIGSAAVRRFAGWSHDGRMIAWVASPKLSAKDGGETWALLLVPIPRARDVLCVAPADATRNERVLLSGMRITFPQWSPTESALSIWATFVPTYRPLLDDHGQLRPGDPAATINVRTGVVAWMAVNSLEKTQVGHYWLLRGHPTEAARWYDSAAKTRRRESKVSAADPQRELRYRQAAVFRHHCFGNLGRHADAAKELATFRAAFQRTAPQRATPQDGGARQAAAASGDNYELLSALNRGFFAAEAFLSLEAAADGIRFLRQELKACGTDAERMGCGIALAQMLLLSGRHDDYGTLATDVLFPLFLKLRKRNPPTAGPSQGNATLFDADPLHTAMLITLLPLCHPGFQKLLTADRAGRNIDVWKKRRETAGDETSRLLADFVLAAGYSRLGRTADAAVVHRRIASNPARNSLGLQTGIEQLVNDLRQLRE